MCRSGSFLSTAILGFIILGDSFGPLKVLGAVLIIGGILLPNIQINIPSRTSVHLQQ